MFQDWGISMCRRSYDKLLKKRGDEENPQKPEKKHLLQFTMRKSRTLSWQRGYSKILRQGQALSCVAEEI